MEVIVNARGEAFPFFNRYSGPCSRVPQKDQKDTFTEDVICVRK
jgi:hypothetical protein